MTDDERLINETWPLVREAVDEWRPVLERAGFLRHVQARSLQDQLAFWKHMARLDEYKFPEVTEVAREIKEQ